MFLVMSQKQTTIGDILGHCRRIREIHDQHHPVLQPSRRLEARRGPVLRNPTVQILRVRSDSIE